MLNLSAVRREHMRKSAPFLISFKTHSGTLHCLITFPAVVRQVISSVHEDANDVDWQLKVRLAPLGTAQMLPCAKKMKLPRFVSPIP